MPVKVELTMSDIVVYVYGAARIEVYFHFPQYAEEFCREHKCAWRSEEFAELKYGEASYDIVRFNASEVRKLKIESAEGTIKVVP